MNIVLLGAPASGKGTQASLLAEKLGLYHLQTGAIARKLAETDDRIKEIVNSGKLVPEEEISMHVLDTLKNVKPNLSGILFEGFPRFISQYEALENFLKAKGDDIDAVVTLDISKEDAVQRLSSRRICRKCGEIYNLVTNPPEVPGVCKCGGELYQREDDKPESIETRFKYYTENTKTLIDYLADKNKLIRINAIGPIDEIHQRIMTALEGVIK